MKKITRDQARALAESEWWIECSDEQIVKFQLFVEDLLCMDWGRFQQAVQKVLGRPVFTHEFADADALRQEYLGNRPAPTFQEILEQIPEEKRIVLMIGPEKAP